MLLVSAILTPSLVNVMLVLLVQALNVEVTIENAINPDALYIVTLVSR